MGVVVVGGFGDVWSADKIARASVMLTDLWAFFAKAGAWQSKGAALCKSY